MAEFNKPHLDISQHLQLQEYKSPKGSPRGRTFGRIHADHGYRLAAELRAAFVQGDAVKHAILPDMEEIEPAKGIFLEVELHPDASPPMLERKTEKTRQAAVTLSDEGSYRVALFVPDDSRETLAAIFDDYASSEVDADNPSPRKKTRVEPIEHIRNARLQSFWRDDPDALPEDAQTTIWWALWCFRDLAEKVQSAAEALGLVVGSIGSHLRFPEVTVIPVYGRRAAIEMLLFATGGVAELRRASDNPLVFTQDLKDTAEDWIEDLAERITWPNTDAPSVCLLDTGVNRAHPLIEPALAQTDLMSIEAAWGGDDHHDGNGHGTPMAGLALHGDLLAPLLDTEPRELLHRLESVKIIPPNDFPENDPHSYGPITQSAIALAEIQNPNRQRSFCMAITNQNRSGADASAWSAAIDQAAAGAEEADTENTPPKRLIFLAAGNIPDDSNADNIRDYDAFPAEDPSQAWNALTIGGYTEKNKIHDAGYEDWRTFSEVGGASPYSRTSFLWNHSKCPFKPDLVMEAGNRALSSSEKEAVSGLDSLSLLTTSREIDQRPLDVFWATSAATAQAARMGAQISAEHPNYWPETIRALMVHSARWTPSMIRSIHGAGSMAEKAMFIRRFGYGVPDLTRALASASDSLALVAQNPIQPFIKKDGSVRFNEAHIYELPWPRAILEELGNARVRLKVTLSYFVEPNPSFATSIDPARYQSFGLRFDLKRHRETMLDFQFRVNADQRESGEKRRTESDSGWLFGSQQVSSGSIHMDIWEGEAVNLAARNHLYIYPIVGWWRERAALGRHDDQSRYSLILTLETPDTEIDLYTPISQLVQIPLEVEVGR